MGSPCDHARRFLQHLKGSPSDPAVLLRLEASVPPSQVFLDFLRPTHMVDFVSSCLRWEPRLRMMAASAGVHPFLSSPSLSVTVSAEEGRHGRGSICSGFLDEEVLHYLQNCPSWVRMRDECLADDFEPSRCISEEEGRRRMKHEFVG